MVFCCIAIVAIAIVYFIGLWIRQLFLGRRRDPYFAAWPPPPRALAGNGAWPVYGHTRLFRRHVGDVMLKFEPQWTEYAIAGRSLGHCFAIFIWGQWRVGIQGPERAQQFFQQPLQEGWPWTPPVTLLGKSCLALLQQEDIGQAKSLRGMLEKPLSANALQRFAPVFAQAAEQCLLAVEQGVFRKTRSPQKQPPDQCAASPTDEEDCCEDEEEDELEEGACCKLKWEALRSYSLDLVNGPLFEMNLWSEETVSPFKASSHEASFQREEEPPTWKAVLTNWNTPKHARKEEPPTRELMLLWMERIKLGLDVIKLTFGPEWMYVWMFNEYGRAVNARMYVEKLIGGHVERMAALDPQVTHERGHVYHEPTTQPFPLLALHQNLVHSKEGIFGDFSVYPTPAKSTAVGVEEVTPGNRTRCNSMPNTSVAELSPVKDACFASPYVTPFKTEQDLARASPIRKPESISPEGTKWGLKEIRLEGFPQGASMSPLSEVGTCPVPQWKSRPMATPLADTAEATDGTRKPHQKKNVSEVFREIKANREKQKHLSDDGQVVYSFFNPTQRRSFDEADDSPVIKAVKSMNGKNLTETKEIPTHIAPDTSETAEEICKENASQSTQRISNVHKQIEQRSVTNGTHLKTLSSSFSSNKSGILAGSTSAPLKRFATPQIPMTTPFRQQKRVRSTGKKKPIPDTGDTNVQSLLQALLQQRGPEGKGISQTTLMELIINIWMMLEVGNAWTAMAMTLLAWDETALSVIQEELDVLELEFGGELLSPAALDRMKYLDALIYESIRLIPPFLGGLKSTTETVILKDAGVQIPKGSHIFFCQPSRQEFDLFAAVGKRPECLGQQYPCIELFGFLPLQGLEVPLMVLQCKVFLVVTLRNYAPTVSKRNTFIRRVKSAVSFRKSQHVETPEASLRSWAGLTDVAEGSNHSIGAWDVEDGPAAAADQSNHRMTPSEALKQFTKIPFPEPKRVIQLKPRGL
ncbi:hypothetical protein FisN_12Lh069 [Fistulifera solaris]|uniref:Uncharacterized protein n=1 Tax=Fistulifera solaris TaxID=1519565 RepID=A0A1Z5K562_FISSO|nr:hypothetical protein FisN_12Lh069 [Fistulifera solaris]|eukprot:GAX21367.1 hypothetical protein FisN_12Lh069 [Fistulifera solaris]